MFFLTLSFVLVSCVVGDSKLGLKGHGSCPGGYVPIAGPRRPCPLENPECRRAFDLCKQEALSYGDFSETQEESWEKGRPSGCFFNPSTKTVHFNYKYEGGLYFGDDERVCRKNPEILEKYGQQAFAGWPSIKIDHDLYVDERNTTLRRGKASHSVNSGWLNIGDEVLNYNAEPPYMITGWKSSYRKNEHDRAYQFESQRFPGADKHDGISESSFCNIVDSTGATPIDCRCAPGEAVVGIYSEHIQMHERQDRRWKLRCASVINMKISPWVDDHIRTAVTNYGGQDAEASCPEGMVMCGLEGQTSWITGNVGSPQWDRGYKLMCCKAWVYDPTKCEAFEVIVDQMKIGKPPQSRNMVVDTTSSSNCGSATPVQFKIERKREFTEEIEETMTFSKSMSDTFTNKVSTTSKMHWKIDVGIKGGKYAQNGWGFEVHANSESGHEFTKNMAREWTNNVKNDETHSTKKKSIKKDSFSQGYTYMMPAGSRVTLTATVDSYRGDVKWWGTAFCYGSSGDLIETQPIAGTYKGAQIGDTRVIVDTKSCPVDNWETHDYAYCSQGDWMRDPADATKFLKAKSKVGALEACMNNKDCQCVMDPGCKNDSLLKSVEGTASSALGLFNQLKGSYVLCKTGCKKRLEPSSHTCTFSYKEPTCTCNDSGGGPLKNEINCSDRSTFACDEGQTCSDTKDGQAQDYQVQLTKTPNHFACPQGFHEIEAPKMPCYLSNKACKTARSRCLQSAEELGLDFIHDFSEAEALWFPSGCFQTIRDGYVRFNHLGEGALAGQGYSSLDEGKEFLLLCGKDKFVKSDASDGSGGFKFNESPMCTSETDTCFKPNKAYDPKAITPAAPTYTNWFQSEPNNANHGDQDCVIFDPLDGEWKSEHCGVHLMTKLVCGANTGGEFHRFEDQTVTTFNDAAAQCYDRGMFLPYVRNRHDTAALLEETKGERVWIGLNDAATEGSFVWGELPTALTYSNWHTCGYDPTGVWTEVKNKYSAGNVFGVTQFTLENAKKKCDEEPLCKAVTCGKSCTLRGSEILTHTPAGATETTWMRQACADVEQRKYEVSPLVGKCLTKFGEQHPDQLLIEIKKGTETCRSKCTKSNKCQGFSLQTGGKDESDLCILYRGDHAGNLKDGGPEWGNARCHIKSTEIRLADGRLGQETCTVLSAASDIENDAQSYTTGCKALKEGKLDFMELFENVKCPEGRVMKSYKVRSDRCVAQGLSGHSEIEYLCYTAVVESTRTVYSECGLMRGQMLEFLDRTELSCPGEDEVLSGFEFQMGRPYREVLPVLPYDEQNCERLGNTKDEVCHWANPPQNYGSKADCERQCKDRLDCRGYQWRNDGNCDLIFPGCGAEKIKGTCCGWDFVSRACFVPPPKLGEEPAVEDTKCQQEGHANFKMQCSKVKGAKPIGDIAVLEKRTPCNEIAAKPIPFLDRHAIECPSGYVLKSSRLIKGSCADPSHYQYLFRCTPFDPKQRWMAYDCNTSLTGKVVCGADTFTWRFHENTRAPDHVYDPPTYYKLKEAKERCKHSSACNSVTCSNRIDWGGEEMCSLRKNNLETTMPSDLGEKTWDLTYRANYVSLGEKTVTQPQATALCNEKDLPLATATTITALKALQKVGDQSKVMWSSLKAGKDEGIWKWAPPPSKPLKWSNWAKGFPTNNDRLEACAAIYASENLAATDHFKWNDLPCDYVLDSYILCEWREDGKVKYEMSPDRFPYNHAQARAFCEEHGATLATFKNAAEQEQAKFAGKDVFHPNSKFWLGLTRSAPNGNFVWDVPPTRKMRDVPTPNECKLMCFDDWKCKFYNWHKEEGTCELLDAVKDEAGVAKTGSVSGPERCPRRRRLASFFGKN